MNRLKQATENITPNGGSQTLSWQQTFTFDRYGNRNFDEANTTFAGFDKLCGESTELCSDLKKRLNPTSNTSNNRLSTSDDYAFDASGSTTSDPDDRTFIYDGENKQVEVKDSLNNTTGQYWYDGDGRRVKKYVPATGEVTVFIYDAGSKLIGEYSSIVQTGSNAKTVYTTNDHLGSPRINTDGIGAVVSRHDYHPFGEEIARTGYGSDTIRKQFTGYERDSESQLDYARTRYFASGVGRYSTPDPMSGRLLDPQTFNKYVYVRNSPLIFIDPAGEELVLTGDGADDYLAELSNATGYALKRCTEVNAKSGCKKIGQVLIDSTQKRKTGKGISNNLADKLKSVIELKDNKNRDVTVSINAIKDGSDAIPFDDYGKRTVDVADLQAAKSKEGGSIFVAGQLAHVLEEYSQADLLRANEPDASMKDPSGNPITHQEGLDFESSVVSELTGIKVEAQNRFFIGGIHQTPFSYLSMENGKDGFRHTVYWGQTNGRTTYTVQDVKRIAIPRQ